MADTNTGGREQSRPPEVASPLGMNKPRFRHLFAFTTWKGSLVLSMALIASILVGALHASLAIFIGKTFSLVSSYGSSLVSDSDVMSQVTRFCGTMLILGGSGWAANFLLMFLWVAFSELEVRRARCDVFSALLRKEVGWFDKVPNGTSGLLIQIQWWVVSFEYLFSSSFFC